MRLENSLYKFPIQVSFAGLLGTTIDLLKNGWELSLMEHPGRYHGREFHFYGHHKGLNLRLHSAQLFMDGRISFEDFIVNYRTPVLIEHVAQQISIQSHGAFPNLVAQNWDGALGLERSHFEGAFMGIGQMPTEKMTIARQMIDHLGKFSSIEDKSDLYIPSKEIWTIEKHLAEIRKIQEPKQAEIRKRILNDREREKKMEITTATKIYMVS